MHYNTNRIRTSHVGRLPAPKNFSDMRARLARADVTDPKELDAQVVPVVAEIVRHQVEAGIDIVNDGEFWTIHGMTGHYAAHFAGVTARPLQPGEVTSSNLSTRERDDFPEFYAAMDQQNTMFLVPGERPVARPPERAVVRGPLKSKGPDVIKREIDVFRAGIERSGTKVEEAFLAVLAPGWFDHFIINEYYKHEEEFLFALADAVASEYRAVVDAGLILQIDDPGLPDWWDMLKPEPTVDAYRKFAKLRIDAVNHALKGIPEEKVRYHLCWGSWHGPHTHDLPLEHIIDLVLQVNARSYSFEAGNVRHEHEWQVWKDAKIPQGKILMPGVVSHATTLVEHPDLVAHRILRFAAIVGRENVIAGTDCGLGNRVHPEIVWAKFGSLAEGARRATKTLWGR
jgi:5-methyltetrahydropteroyltriglutamate--homocysteine methyltransferase